MKRWQVLILGILITAGAVVGIAWFTKDKRTTSIVLEHATSLQPGRAHIRRTCTKYVEGVCRGYLFKASPENGELHYWLIVRPVHNGRSESVFEVEVTYATWNAYQDGDKYP